MEHPSLYQVWRALVDGAGESQQSAQRDAWGLCLEARDEEGDVWLLDPLALVSSYDVSDEVREKRERENLVSLSALEHVRKR